MLEPNAVVLYVDNLLVSSEFYQNLLGIKQKEAFPTFHSFKLSNGNGMGLGLKAKHAVEPTPDGSSANGELAFTLDNNKKVDEVFAEWQEKDITILTPPTTVPYGYTFVAVDPDGHRLRVVSLGKS